MNLTEKHGSKMYLNLREEKRAKVLVSKCIKKDKQKCNAHGRNAI